MPELLFHTHRSDIYGTKGMINTSQPLAAQVGLEILKKGGTAAEAAVAAAAVLTVTEPVSTSIGGDAFCLYYTAEDKSVRGLNGSGRSPKNLTLERVVEELGSEIKTIPVTSPHAMTVPGACALMCDTVEKFGSGKFSLGEILEGAIMIAEEGYPVAEITAEEWTRKEKFLLSTPNGHELLKEGRAPEVGELINLPNLAKTYRRISELGKDGFYQGPIAQSIVDLIQSQGGVMTLQDLKDHQTEVVEPISYCYQNRIKVFECPPNGQGLTALIALGILDILQEDGVIPDLASLDPTSSEYLHILVEVMKIAFADTRWHVADPDFYSCDSESFLTKDYLRTRSKLFDPTHANLMKIPPGSPHTASNTVYITAVDEMGNACSFIMSCYQHFGSGQIPSGWGFVMQNRGCGFHLDPHHPNRLAPSKRPYHTIIPSLALHHPSNDLYLCYGVMGRFMQPQGHLQILLQMIHHRATPQAALDFPRFCVDPDSPNLHLEPGLPPLTLDTLTQLGHSLTILTGHDRNLFGRGQIIRQTIVNPPPSPSEIITTTAPVRKVVLTGGCDGRSDGQALGY